MNENDSTADLSDLELDRLLSHASLPSPNIDFESRLLEKLKVSAISNVVTFPRAMKAPFWFVGLPLAASLIFGIWVGASDTASDYLSFTTEALAQNVVSLLTPQNKDDLDFFAEDNLS